MRRYLPGPNQTARGHRTIKAHYPLSESSFPSPKRITLNIHFKEFNFHRNQRLLKQIYYVTLHTLPLLPTSYPNDGLNTHKAWSCDTLGIQQRNPFPPKQHLLSAILPLAANRCPYGTQGTHLCQRGIRSDAPKAPGDTRAPGEKLLYNLAIMQKRNCSRWICDSSCWKSVKVIMRHDSKS